MKKICFACLALACVFVFSCKNNNSSDKNNDEDDKVEDVDFSNPVKVARSAFEALSNGDTKTFYGCVADFDKTLEPLLGADVVKKTRKYYKEMSNNPDMPSLYVDEDMYNEMLKAFESGDIGEETFIGANGEEYRCLRFEARFIKESPDDERGLGTDLYFLQNPKGEWKFSLPFGAGE